MDQDYLISIITPTYNTPDELFRAAFDSVMAQTLDESLIEWVIVVHNSSKEHLGFVRRLCDGHPGIRVLELNNDKHTASSPRNHALSVARGKYVTFLDADDMLTPECLATLVSGMEETGAQIGKFRGEKTEEDETITGFLDNRVRFSQTRPLICLQKGDPDVNKLMTMANMMMSCQVVERSHIEKHGIRFREDVRIYEDVMFNMESLRDADTIAVFPQLIGYIYYMHHGSTMQELSAPKPEKILSTCRDIALQLRLGVDSGLYMRYLFFGHMKQIADMISASEKEYGMPEEILREIRGLLEPFFALIDPPEPDRKFLSAEEIEEIMSYIRLTITGKDDREMAAGQPDTTAVLIDILRSAEDAEIGENWGFGSIRSHKVYERQVPVNVYDSFAPMIDLMSRIGESGIIFSDSIRGYAVTSGTMNVPRKIPYTDRTIGVYEDMLRDLLRGEDAGAGSCFMLAGSIRGDRPYADRTYPDSITGAVLQRMRTEFTYNSHANAVSEGIRLTGPEELFFLDKATDPRYLRLLFALLDRNVTQIISPFSWGMLDTFRYLESNHEKLVTDIEKGTLAGAPWLSSEDRERFSALFRADPERAGELRDIFAPGFDDPVISRIWPECRRVIAGGSADFSLYTHHLRRYTGDIPVLNGGHVSSEALIGTDCGGGCCRLACGESYFEFIPYGASGTGSRAMTAEELEAGRPYELLVTNRAGLYRYALGDVIRVERMEEGTPVYRLIGRTGSLMTIPGKPEEPVHIEPEDMTELLRNMEERFGVIIEDYCIEWDGEGACMRLYAEPCITAAGLRSLTSVPRDEFAIAAEEELRRLVPAYGRAVSDGDVRPLAVCMLQPETQLAYRDKRMYVQKTAPDQIKPVHVLTDNPAAERFFRAFAEKE